jgi:hypothetical protein
MRTKRNSIFILMLGVMFLVANCAGIAPQKPGVCDTIPEGQTSVICDLAHKVGQSPETVAGILKLGNVAALAGHLYTAHEASLFIDITINHLKFIQANGDGLTYMSAVQYVLNALSGLSPETQAVFIILEDFMYFDFGEIRVLSDFDIGMLLKHLNDQKMLIAPFLMKG